MATAPRMESEEQAALRWWGDFLYRNEIQMLSPTAREFSNRSVQTIAGDPVLLNLLLEQYRDHRRAGTLHEPIFPRGRRAVTVMQQANHGG